MNILKNVFLFRQKETILSDKYLMPFFSSSVDFDTLSSSFYVVSFYPLVANRLLLLFEFESWIYDSTSSVEPDCSLDTCNKIPLSPYHKMKMGFLLPGSIEAAFPPPENSLLKIKYQNNIVLYCEVIKTK